MTRGRGGMAYTADLKSASARIVGSSPTGPTKMVQNMFDLSQYTDEQLFDFWCEEKGPKGFALACYTEYSRRRLERKMKFPIKVGNRYRVHTKMSGLPGKVPAGVWKNNDDKDCDNGSIPAGEEVVLTENLTWEESFVYGTWNGRKVALAAYHLEPIE